MTALINQGLPKVGFRVGRAPAEGTLTVPELYITRAGVCSGALVCRIGDAYRPMYIVYEKYRGIPNKIEFNSVYY